MYDDTIIIIFIIIILLSDQYYYSASFSALTLLVKSAAITSSNSLPLGIGLTWSNSREVGRQNIKLSTIICAVTFIVLSLMWPVTL